MNKKQIKDLALSNGFKLKEQPSGEIDLNPYVYDFADALLTKANERVKELEQVNLELAANVEACCELTEMDMGAAIESLFEIDNTESKALLNKFAIEKKIEALEGTLRENSRPIAYPHGHNTDVVYSEDIKFDVEQLRKEQE